MNWDKWLINPAATLGFIIVMLGHGTAYAAVLSGSNGGNSLLHAIGWQTFDNAGGNNNSGITDTTPESNSTFDATPFGSNKDGLYLTGIIGAGASGLGRDGYGQSTANNFLQGPTFGDSPANKGLNIVDVPDADGTSPGTRQNQQGVSGSSWKFRGNEGNNSLHGDFSITNESDYTFRLEKIHYDARAGTSNSPSDLDIIYLSGGASNLTRADNGNELNNLTVLSAITFGTQPSIQNVSQNLPGALGVPTALRLAPGDSASFRFRWSKFGGAFAESQIDNLAFSGTFQDQHNSFALIDPVNVVPEPATFALLTLGILAIATQRRRLA
ncbi:MAG: hypothetical protein CMJ80_02800 [Planctomycetaceae bacterium]|nr:hypothetical protein [Planctomycetaceae bacterium]